MNPLKKLAGQTAIYGVGTILGRILNYLLTPLYTGIFSSEVYAVFNEGYAYVAILLVILTYGMETALFHFCEKTTDKKKVFSTGMISLTSTTGLFWLFVFSFSAPLSELMRYPGHREYVVWLGMIVGLDALTALPMAWLRQQNKAGKFSFISLSNIVINIGLNVFFLVYCRNHYLQYLDESNTLVKLVYNHNIGVGYVFIANLIASGLKFLFCLPIVLKNISVFDKELLGSMLRYSWPLVIAGLGFIINERMDILMLKYLLPYDDLENKKQVGIYSACYKIAILMSIFIQAFRFAAEPYFFQQNKFADARKNYALVMNYFVIFCCFIYLFVLLYIDIFKHFLQNEEYWKGLNIVPIIMMANIFLGIYMNLSMWYKLSGQTKFGAWFSVLGAFITIGFNFYFIPRWGYMASAWATLITYFTMMTVSYLFGRRYYPIPYNIRKITLYILVSLIMYGISSRIPFDNKAVVFIINTLLFVPFFYLVYIFEKPIRDFIQKKLKKYGIGG